MTDQEEFDLERELQRLNLSSEQAQTREKAPAGLRPLRPEEIGRVAISEELFISTTEHCIEVYIPEEKRNDVAVGQYVVIPLEHREQKLFAYLKKLSYRKRDAIDDMSEVHVLLSAESVGEDEYIQLAELEPISMISAEGLPTEVRYLPKPNALVRRVTSKDEVVLGLDLPDDGLFLGYVAVNGEPITLSGGFKIPYYLINDARKTGDPILFTHVLIAGMSGRGKTHMAKNFLRQIVGSEYTLERRGGERRKPCLVIIDPENEYWGLRDDHPELSRVPQEERDHLIGVGGKLGGLREKLTVFSAVEAGGSYHGCEAHTDFTIPFELVGDFPYLIAGGELNEAQYAALERLIRDFFRASSDQQYAAFRRFLEDETNMQPYLASGVIHEATLGAIRRRVLLPQFSHIFDQGANPLTKLYESIFMEDRVSVFPTNHLSAEGERVVVLAVMSLIAEGKTKAVEATDWGRRIAKYPLILAVDEAHSYLTQSQTQQDRIIVQKFVTAAKQGRKNRLGLVFITQNPQDVSEEVLSQISTRILLGMEQGMAERAGAPKQYHKALPYFEKGRMIVHSPDNSRPLEIRGLPFCVVKH
jgi:DNA helicase HerA-like ATPase